MTFKSRVSLSLTSFLTFSRNLRMPQNVRALFNVYLKRLSKPEQLGSKRVFLINPEQEPFSFLYSCKQLFAHPSAR